MAGIQHGTQAALDLIAGELVDRMPGAIDAINAVSGVEDLVMPHADDFVVSRSISNPDKDATLTLPAVFVTPNGPVQIVEYGTGQADHLIPLFVAFVLQHSSDDREIVDAVAFNYLQCARQALTEAFRLASSFDATEGAGVHRVTQWREAVDFLGEDRHRRIAVLEGTAWYRSLRTFIV